MRAVFASKSLVGSQSLVRFCGARSLLLLVGINRLVGGTFIGRVLICAGAVFCLSNGLRGANLFCGG